MKIKYEVREGGRYCATFKTYEDALELIKRGTYPICGFGNAVILKITTEIMWGEKAQSNSKITQVSSLETEDCSTEKRN